MENGQTAQQHRIQLLVLLTHCHCVYVVQWNMLVYGTQRKQLIYMSRFADIFVPR